MNLARQTERYLPQQIIELVRIISEKADDLGQRAYLVGGVIRDLLLGYPSFDLDLVVEGDAVKLAQRIAEISQAKLVTHSRFGTATLGYSDFTLDMTTARSESYAKPGALPTVTPAILNDDLLRRDFSINAMAMSLSPNNYGELIDPHQGRSDLEHHLIRILHPESFRDDATRILRAIRYEQRMGFELERQTARLLKRDIPMLDTISGDRIRRELELIFREKYPEHTITQLGELGVLQRINPYLKSDDRMADRFRKARLLDRPGQLPVLYFCLLVYSLSEEENEQFIRRLNMPANLSRALHDTLCLKARIPPLDESSVRRSEIYYLLHRYEPLAIQANAVASDSPTVCSNIELYLTRLRYVRTSLSGEGLKMLGVPAGAGLGRILQALQAAKLDGEVKTRTEEESLVKVKMNEIAGEP